MHGNKIQTVIEKRPALVLAPYDIHIWFVFPHEIRSDSILSAYKDLMSPDELERQQKFYFAKDRHQFLITRALVRTTLSRYTGIAPEDLRFYSNEYGRPEIFMKKNSMPLRFNLSHSDGLIGCAVILNASIGLDIEKIDRRGINFACTDQFLSKKEAADLLRIEEERKRSRFFEYWTLKESYIKARGMGLSIPLEQFSFKITDHAPLSVTFNTELDDNPERWKFYLFNPTPHHRTAVSIHYEGLNEFKLLTKKMIPLIDEGDFNCPIMYES